MTNEEIIDSIVIDGTGIEVTNEEAKKCMDAARRDEAIAFLEKIRDYEHESGNQICYDERTSEQLYQLFKQQP